MNEKSRYSSSITLPTGEKLQVMAQGWYCPRCHKVNNPTLDQCLCDADKHTYATQVTFGNEHETAKILKDVVEDLGKRMSWSGDVTER